MDAHSIAKIDQMIKSPSISASEEAGSSNSSFDIMLCRTILEAISENSAIAHSDPVGTLFSSQLPPKSRRFAAICLLRYVTTDVRDSTAGQNLWHHAFHLFDQELHKDIYSQLKLEVKQQTFEKEAKLKQALHNVEGEFKEVIDSFSSLQILATIKKQVMQKLNNFFARAVLWPFLPHERPDVRLLEVFSEVEEYLQQHGARTMSSYDQAAATLMDYIAECESYSTDYSQNYLAAFARKVLLILREHFDKSDFSKPALLSIDPADKKYPFTAIGNRFNIALIVRNIGSGHAFDVSLEIVDATDLGLHQPQSYLGSLEPGSQLIDFPASVERCTQTACIEGHLRWTNFDKSISEHSFFFELSGQRSDIDWKNLSMEDPYALEPVSSEDDLIGRKDVLDQLLIQARSKALGSCLILGQKRVGKTSIVKTLCNRLSHSKESNVQAIYLEGGDYISPDPLITITTLGRLLCGEIRRTDVRLETLAIPQFDQSIAPLVEYLGAAVRIASDLRILFILDEFDELPIELYKRGPIGDAFFLTIRGISNKAPFGFVLVGSEKIDPILSFQGERLNKFQYRPIDYFDKEKHWTDFVDLVRRPVAHCLEFSDDSLATLYDQSAGNPFFTKQIGGELFRMMVARRDSHVTSKEVHEATAQTLSTVTTSGFQHFWDDGILESGERKEEKSLLRRKVLLAFAEVMRSNLTTTNEQIVVQAERYGLDSFQVEEELREFVRRKIFRNVNGSLRCKVPFFEKWLAERGINSIITTIADPDAALERRRREEDARVKPEEIVELIKRWGLYQGRTISEEQVRVWLNQWQGNITDQRLMFRILQNVQFYSADIIRAKLHEAHGIIGRGTHQNIEKTKRADFLVSYLDSVGKSGADYARLYADENNIYYTQVVEQGKLVRRLDTEGVRTLVFIDDFLGTGRSVADNLKSFLKENMETLHRSNISIFIVAICGFEKARERIKAVSQEAGFPVSVHICDPLNDSASCFSENSAIFHLEEDRNRARDLAYSQGIKLEKKHPLGYGGCEATVVFESTCPNNTLPILWKSSNSWVPLFSRF